MKLRRAVFFLIDRLKGGKLKHDLEDIKQHFEQFYAPEREGDRKSKLHEILRHAGTTTPFYRGIESTDITDFPVIDKLLIKEREDDFISSRHEKSKLNIVTTSGSTGTPLRIFRDRRKLLRHKADNIFFSRINNYVIGDRLYYTRVWNNVNEKSPFEKKMMNIVSWEMSNLSDERFDLLTSLLRKDRQDKTILGFSSFFEAYARYLEQQCTQPVDARINSIITMSEHLPDGSRQVLEECLNTECFSRYSNMENGFIANQYKLGLSYHINHGSYLVEILDLESDLPVPYGQIGRIVVTDYYNFGMPLIRYDTGDLGVMDKSDQWGPYLKRVEGRKTDFIYNTKGELMSPHTITNTMWKFSDVKQFQFIQHAKDRYEIKLNINIQPYPKENQIKKELLPYLGNNAEIHFSYVSEIPRLRSGKVKKILNLMEVQGQKS